MTKEDKELLLKDICARLPYGVCVSARYNYTGEWFDGVLTDVYKYGKDVDIIFRYTASKVRGYSDSTTNLDYIKPYLRPMSSMTEEERDYYRCEFYSYGEEGYYEDYVTIPDELPNILDWLLAHHFDYRGLIDKGLALKAPEGMYKEGVR